MPHPVTSPAADPQQAAVERPDYDAVYEVDVELLRGCRHPLTRYAPDAAPANLDLWAAGRRGAR